MAEILFGFYTYDQMNSGWGRGKWRAMQRFALWQQGHEAWRVIDNGKFGPNWTYEAAEKIHTTSPSMGFATVRRMRQLKGGRLEGE